MSNKNFGFAVPNVTLPCGEMVALPLPAIAQLRSAGVNQLKFENCWACHEEHIADLPEMSIMLVMVQSDLLVSPLVNGG